VRSPARTKKGGQLDLQLVRMNCSIPLRKFNLLTEIGHKTQDIKKNSSNYEKFKINTGLFSFFRVF
jgi:hypothetical protein